LSYFFPAYLITGTVNLPKNLAIGSDIIPPTPLTTALPPSTPCSDPNTVAAASCAKLVPTAAAP